MDILMTSTEYIEKLNTVLLGLDVYEIDMAVEMIRDAWISGHQIICMGNGGSALTAQHFITDWTKGIYLRTGIPFYGRCLLDVGVVTAYANDFSYQDIFEAQLIPMLRGGDLVIGISGSGESENVVRAIEYANGHGGKTLGLCGFSGGRLRGMAQRSVWVVSQDMQIVEDIHMMFGHLVMQVLGGE